LAETASTQLGEQRRRSTRLEQTWPVIIRGIDLLGQPFEERTATQNLSFQGCRYASKHHLPKNTWVTLEVPSGDSQKDAACVRARVAWIQRPRSLRELFQVGVEMEKPNNIWNVVFPPHDWSSQAPGEISVRTASRGSADAGPINGLSLEDYFRMASAHHEMSAAKGEKQGAENLDHAEVEQLRPELLGKTRSDAQQLPGGEMQEKGFPLAHAAEKAFYDRWFAALERDKNSAKAEIASAVSGQVAAQLAAFEQNLRDSLTSVRNENSLQAQTEFLKRQSDVEVLRNELRAGAEAIAAHIEERLDEKLAALRQEVEVSLKGNLAAVATENEGCLVRRDPDGEGRDKFREETEAARQELREALKEFDDSLRAHMEEAEAGELEKARRIFACAASEELETVNREFAKAAEAAAVTLGEIIDERTETALAQFASALEGRSGEGRANLVAASENALHHLQTHAQTLFEHFQEQLALKSEQTIRDAGDALGHQLGTRIEKFRERVEAALEEWSAKQQARSERVFEANQERMQRAAQAAIEAALEQLEHRAEERISLATRAMESAVRQACTDVFEAVAQRMREQLQGIGDTRRSSAGEASQSEHRAST